MSSTISSQMCITCFETTCDMYVYIVHFRSRGEFYPKNAFSNDTLLGMHSTVCDGWNDNDSTLIFNSWGANWGGRGRHKHDYTRLNNVFYASEVKGKACRKCPPNAKVSHSTILTRLPSNDSYNKSKTSNPTPSTLQKPTPLSASCRTHCPTGPKQHTLHHTLLNSTLTCKHSPTT